MSLEGKRFLELVEDMYEDLELWYPTLRLKEADAEVTIVGPSKDTRFTSKHGYPAVSNAAAKEVSGTDFDGVIIPGGYAPDRMRRHAEMVDLVRDVSSAQKIVAAICHGGWMLCSAGVLKNRKVTSFFAIKDDMVNAGADWVDQAVVRDDSLITSRTPDDLPMFMSEIIAASLGQA